MATTGKIFLNPANFKCVSIKYPADKCIPRSAELITAAAWRVPIGSVATKLATEVISLRAHQDPKEIILALRRSIVMDIRAKKSLEQCQALALLRELSRDELYDLEENLTNKYFPSRLDIRVPGSMIVLETFFIRNSRGFGIKGKITPEVIFAMIYSLRKINRIDTIKMPFKFKPDGNDIIKSEYFNDNRSFQIMNIITNPSSGISSQPVEPEKPADIIHIVPCDGYTIHVHIDPSLDRDEIVNNNSLRNIIQVIQTLNMFMPEEGVRDVRILPSKDAWACYAGNEVTFDLDILRSGTDCNTAAHEMGHAIYEDRFYKRKETDAAFTKLFALSLYKECHHLFLDRNYDHEPNAGHPNDSETELFASAVATFMFGANRFGRFIRNNSTPEEMRTFGRLVYCYLRDRVFNGIFVDGKFCPKGSPEFRKYDLFPDNSFETEFAAVTSATLTKALESCPEDDEATHNSKAMTAFKLRFPERKHSFVLQRMETYIRLIKEGDYYATMQLVKKLGLSDDELEFIIRAFFLDKLDPKTRDKALRLIDRRYGFFLRKISEFGVDKGIRKFIDLCDWDNYL